MILKEKYKEMLSRIFTIYNYPYQVWAYGSRVNGDAHDGSDLDLVIRMKSGEAFPMQEFFELQNTINQSNVPILIDLRDWHHLPESFQKNILNQHEVFYDSEPQ
ncbi:MAG: nucleotidyltransferase domain-containing protein [Saprospiraceae bacterium]|nr:nucleotidyltransferase domain-containing protein [Saprospiraceae bacterium]